ncbi:MAG: response regulator with CheY-like receiver domain and winged-helix DNA-binding domain [Verrucomicrobia bacterium]|nr:response regulator with CheY-like receiver domain and winged-helix DNA-binding domain [Verrucomicrobiota bacterium]
MLAPIPGHPRPSMNLLGRILYAEDNAHDVELTLSALAESHLANEVVVVGDGAEALDYLYLRGRFKDRRKGNPTLVLLDLKMPKVTGLEVLAAIKQDEKLRAIPVVILTSSQEEQDLARSYALGVNSFVLKPVGFEGFMDAVKKLGIYWALVNQAPLGSLEPRP